MELKHYRVIARIETLEYTIIDGDGDSEAQAAVSSHDNHDRGRKLPKRKKAHDCDWDSSRSSSCSSHSSHSSHWASTAENGRHGGSLHLQKSQATYGDIRS